MQAEHLVASTGTLPGAQKGSDHQGACHDCAAAEVQPFGRRALVWQSSLGGKRCSRHEECRTLKQPKYASCLSTQCMSADAR